MIEEILSGISRHHVLPAGRPRRRAAQDRPADRRGVRPLRSAAPRDGRVMDDDPHLDDGLGRGILDLRPPGRARRRGGTARARPRHAARRGDRAGGALRVLRRRRTRSPSCTSGSWTSRVRPTCCRSRWTDVDEDERPAPRRRRRSRPRRRRGTTRATPWPSSGCSSCTGSCICSATTTRRTARAPGCGSGRSATAGCARRDLVVGPRGRARALRVGARRGRGVAHPDDARPRAGARRRTAGGTRRRWSRSSPIRRDT